jgi:AcrR family transcriptional regulator
MARTVDPERHRARRSAILDAAVTCFAARGFASTTTAQVCAQAGIGSGTLFHYFPTKASLMTALLEEDTREVGEFFTTHRDRPAGDGLAAWVERAIQEAADPRVAGLVDAMVGAAALPEVAGALAANEAVIADGLTALVRRGQEEGTVRADLSAPRVASWVTLLVDGFYGRIASDEAFRPADEAGVLRATVAALLSGG